MPATQLLEDRAQLMDGVPVLEAFEAERKADQASGVGRQFSDSFARSRKARRAASCGAHGLYAARHGRQYFPGPSCICPQRESGTALLEEAVAARREELTESAPLPAAESIVAQ
jgi:hypothetical protein